MTSHSRLSASASHRWVHCPGSVFMSEGFENQTNEASLEGTKAHALAEKMLKREYWECDDEEMIKHVQYYVDYVNAIPGSKFVEQKISYSDLTSVDEINGEEDSYGTSDILIIDGDDVHVIDFKYGLQKVHAEKNYQLLCYAYPYYALKKNVTVHIVQPRIDWVDVWELKGIEVDLMYADLSAAAKLAVAAYETKQPPLTAGDHCIYCRARGQCKAYAVYATSDFEVVADPYLLTEQELANCLNKSKHLLSFLDAAKNIALIKAQNGDIIPGWELGKGRQGNRKWKVDITPIVGEVAYKKEVRSPTELEKFLPRKGNEELWQTLDESIDRSPAKPVLVPVSTSDFSNDEDL